MEKFISYEKLSKKKRRELAAKRRGSWGGLNPVTRKPENSKAYNRKKARKWSDGSPMTVPFELDYFPCTDCFRTSALMLLGHKRQISASTPLIFCFHKSNYTNSFEPTVFTQPGL